MDKEIKTSLGDFEWGYYDNRKNCLNTHHTVCCATCLRRSILEDIKSGAINSKFCFEDFIILLNINDDDLKKTTHKKDIDD